MSLCAVMIVIVLLVVEVVVTVVVGSRPLTYSDPCWQSMCPDLVTSVMTSWNLAWHPYLPCNGSVEAHCMQDRRVSLL